MVNRRTGLFCRVEVADSAAGVCAARRADRPREAQYAAANEVYPLKQEYGCKLCHHPSSLNSPSY